MTQPGRRRLERVRVQGLFGEYNHDIRMHNESHITAIIAPNGAGKTVCLKIIHALMNRNWTFFSGVEYDRITFDFDDGNLVIIERGAGAPDLLGDDAERPFNVVLQYGLPSSLMEWTPASRSPRLGPATIERILPFVSQIGPQRWAVEDEDVTFSTWELLDRYRGILPDRIWQDIDFKEPEELKNLISGFECRLIETQRLIVFRSAEKYSSPRYRTNIPNLAISEKARLLSDIITRELRAYANRSQELDRSFPRRILESAAPPDGSQRPAPTESDDLRRSLQELENQRRELVSTGILDSSATDAVNLPASEIPSEIRSVMDIYVRDTEEKLACLRNIFKKVRLFRELVDRRFAGKELKIGKEVGFAVYRGSKRIPLDRLSSGEQHQLVLLFELIFETPSAAIILIDEPEISLHVSWQLMFIPDLQKIVELNNFEVILATHSPALVSRWSDCVVDLGYVESDETASTTEASIES